jgi:hypothetical protein
MFGIWDDDLNYFKGIQITRGSKTKTGVFIGKPELYETGDTPIFCFYSFREHLDGTYLMDYSGFTINCVLDPSRTLSMNLKKQNLSQASYRYSDLWRGKRLVCDKQPDSGLKNLSFIDAGPVILGFTNINQNIVTESDPSLIGYATGLCLCPDGSEYPVGGRDHSCQNLACDGGQSSRCDVENPITRELQEFDTSSNAARITFPIGDVMKFVNGDMIKESETTSWQPYKEIVLDGRNRIYFRPFNLTNILSGST